MGDLFVFCVDSHVEGFDPKEDKFLPLMHLVPPEGTKNRDIFLEGLVQMLLTRKQPKEGGKTYITVSDEQMKHEIEQALAKAEKKLQKPGIRVGEIVVLEPLRAEKKPNGSVKYIFQRPITHPDLEKLERLQF